MSQQKKGLCQEISKYLLAICLSTLVASAWAQDAPADAEDEEEDAAALDRVTVTGSLIRREEFTSTSPMQVITAETQVQSGRLTLADMLQDSTVAAGTTQFNNQFNGFIVQGGTGAQPLDLRGLGAARSLVLLNGRRPGGSGTRGEVNSVDLNTIPEIATNRVELVLDGSSSIYGSDAVAGVANIITRRSVEGTEVSVLGEAPYLNSGGEFYRIGGITGWNTDRGAFTVSAQWDVREKLAVEDRDFLNCFQDRITDGNGNRIDRQDRSITAGTPLEGCNNLYANTVIDFTNGQRYIPSPDGVTIGPIPGYRPRTNGGVPPDAFYEDVLNFDFIGNESAINRLERTSIYATADYNFDFLGGVAWETDFLYTNRKSEAEGWRQFFPFISSPEWPAALPVMPYTSNDDVEVDYYYFTTGLQGEFATSRYWSWQTYASYSYSDGDYGANDIQASRSGDADFDPNPPVVDYFDPAFLSGANLQELIDAVGFYEVGNTVYDQLQWTGIITGDLFDLPAGTVGTAFGIEYREFSIDDQPGPVSQAGDKWGSSSAIATEGENDVVEAFLEMEIPIIRGITAVEDLTANLSYRAFDYDLGGSDDVWKAGLNWSIDPTIRLRATAGTSFRAPALFEQFLGNQTSFLGQNGIDPCIDWGESTNDNIRSNCAAAGIPSDYAGAGSSALIISGGGVDNLTPETSDALTYGFVWTPEFADLSIAADYFEFEVNNQIAQLGAQSIVNGCYSGNNFPNAFCDLFERAPGDDPARPNQILTVDDTFVNVNEQTVRGVDLTALWNQDSNFGILQVEAQATYTIENTQRLFAPGSVEGFDETDFAGRIGSPELVANLRASISRNDWRYTWSMQYVSETDNKDIANEEFTYFGFEGARRDITMESVLYHNFSVLYETGTWGILLGINNLLDEEPDLVSTGSGSSTPRGNVPIAASQYDLLGRRIFARLNYYF